MTSWYKVETTNGVYYTPFKTKKTEYFHIDNRLPEPYESVDKMNNLNDCMYLQDGIFTHSIEEATDPKVELPPGVYRHRHGSGSIREGLVPFEIREDEYIALGSAFEEVIQDLKDFYANEKFYRNVNTLYKLGILMYSAPGLGKSSLLRHLLKKALPDGSIVIYVNDDLFTQEFIDHMKDTLNGRLKFIIFEEITTSVVQYRALERMLNFLDGESSMDGQIVLATTNYPENLPGNLVDRPSRFDKLIKFDYPGVEDRTKILTHYLGREPSTTEVDKTKDMSIAAIKEVVTLMMVNNSTFEQAIKKMNDRKAVIKKEFAESKNKVGFGYD